jgi:hypothetical protein
LPTPSTISGSDEAGTFSDGSVRVFSVLDKVTKYVLVSFILMFIAMALLICYPWLALQKDGSLDPNDGISTTFVVVNRGHEPINNMEADCRFSFGSRTSGVK